jgi:hypothetical protein
MEVRRFPPPLVSRQLALSFSSSILADNLRALVPALH